MNWSKNKGCILTVIIGSILAIGILFPTIGCSPESPQKNQARNDSTQLVNAIKCFYTEYGIYPKMPEECVSSDSKLLAILMGTDLQQNLRKIVFLEVQPAKKKEGRWTGGLHPETGAWLDPYGNSYLVKIDTNNDGFIPNPYADGKAGDHPIPRGVIVWSSGKDGIFGNPKARNQFQGSDDIISWQ